MRNLEKIIKTLQLDKELVLLYSGITEEEYNELVFEYGIKFCNNYLKGPLHTQSVAPQLEDFWNWYRYQWSLSNGLFLDQMTLDLEFIRDSLYFYIKRGDQYLWTDKESSIAHAYRNFMMKRHSQLFIPTEICRRVGLKSARS